MDISTIHKAAALGVQSIVTPPSVRQENRELIQAVKAVNQAEFYGTDRELSFARDRETGRPILRILDRETKEVVEQIPAEYLLRLAQDLRLNRSKTTESRR
jgi:flagellar protein FlaG